MSERERARRAAERELLVPDSDEACVYTVQVLGFMYAMSELCAASYVVGVPHCVGCSGVQN